MRLGRPPRRRQYPETVVPMINVVFLLLIFFLMSAVIATPPPIDVRLPGSEDGETVRGAPDALYVAADGTLAFGEARGSAAIALAAAVDAPLDVRADAGLTGATLARLLADLSDAGVGDVRLMTVAE